MAKKALLIDDSPDIRSAVELAGTLEGHQIYCVDCGQKALDFLADCKEKPAVILLDIRMPDMDGSEFLRLAESKGLLVDVPVLLFSGLSMPEMDLANPCVCGCLPKPLVFDDLKAVFSKYL